jgi:hypothetical protein
MMIESECLVCGNHDMCDLTKINICDQCNNGVMKKYKEEI